MANLGLDITTLNNSLDSRIIPTDKHWNRVKMLDLLKQQRDRNGINLQSQEESGKVFEDSIKKAGMDLLRVQRK